MILANGLDIQIERGKITALFSNQTFVKDFNKFLKEIQFNHGQGSKDYNGEWIEVVDAFSADEITSEGGIPVRTLSEILENFYQKYGTDYQDAAEFIALIADTMRTSLKADVRANIIAEQAQSPVVVDSNIEEERAELLKYFQPQANTTYAEYIDYPLIFNELQNCSQEKVQLFINFVRAKKQELIDGYEADIEEYERLLQENKFKYSYEKFETEQKLKLAKRYLSYYLSVDDFEASVPIVFHSSLVGGNEIIAIFVDKRINEQVLSQKIKDMQFINNLDQSIKKGLVAKNQYFNGVTVFDRTSGESLSPKEHDKTEFVGNIVDFKRRNQTNFAYDPEIVANKLSKLKYPMYGAEVTTQGSPVVEKFSIFKTDNFNIGEKNAVFPLYLKHVVENPVENTLSIMLYVFETPDINLGTQIYRIDKVPPQMRGGASSRHTQANQSQIITNIHEHLYSLLDRLMINPDKWRELGHGDVSQNFVTDSQLDNRSLELLFNQKCGIDDEPTKVVHINNQQTSTQQLV